VQLHEHASDAYIAETPIAAYFCPSRRAPMVKGVRAMNDYAGNGGLYATTNAYWGDGLTGGVIVRRDRGALISLASITDGTSLTIAAGEKRLDLQALAQPQCDDNEGFTSGWDWDIIRWGNDPPLPDSRGPDQCEVLFGSSHPGGTQFVLCDGAVRIIPFTVDKKVFQNLCQRNDGNQIVMP
jgi:hypothetical protein